MFEKIISGGQTGVDRAALDVALILGISCGGWCPQGRKAEDGKIDPKYPLKEADSLSYSVRARKNVKESDGTLVLTSGKPTGGTFLTIESVGKFERPHLVVNLRKSSPSDFRKVLEWGRANQVRVLNVAGPRESEAPGIYDREVNTTPTDHPLCHSERPKEAKNLRKAPDKIEILRRFAPQNDKLSE